MSCDKRRPVAASLYSTFFPFFCEDIFELCPPFPPLNLEMSGSAIEIINESFDSVRSKDSGQSSAQHGGHSGEGAS